MTETLFPLQSVFLSYIFLFDFPSNYAQTDNWTVCCQIWNSESKNLEFREANLDQTLLEGFILIFPVVWRWGATVAIVSTASAPLTPWIWSIRTVGLTHLNISTGMQRPLSRRSWHLHSWETVQQQPGCDSLQCQPSDPSSLPLQEGDWDLSVFLHWQDQGGQNEQICT